MWRNELVVVLLEDFNERMIADESSAKTFQKNSCVFDV